MIYVSPCAVINVIQLYINDTILTYFYLFIFKCYTNANMHDVIVHIFMCA